MNTTQDQNTEPDERVDDQQDVEQIDQQHDEQVEDSAQDDQEQSEDERSDEDEEQDEEQEGAAPRLAREARKFRKRLAETRAELEQTQARVDALKGGIIAQHIEGKKLGEGLVKLLTVEGYATENFVQDDGSVDGDALDSAMTEINSKFGTSYGVMRTLNPRKRNTSPPAGDWSRVLDTSRM